MPCRHWWGTSSTLPALSTKKGAPLQVRDAVTAARVRACQAAGRLCPADQCAFALCLLIRNEPVSGRRSSQCPAGATGRLLGYLDCSQQTKGIDCREAWVLNLMPSLRGGQGSRNVHASWADCVQSRHLQLVRICTLLPCICLTAMPQINLRHPCQAGHPGSAGRKSQPADNSCPSAKALT